MYLIGTQKWVTEVASDNFDFIVILVIDNGLGFDSLASALGLDVYVRNEKLKIKSGEDIRTRTFGLTSARAAASLLHPVFEHRQHHR